MSGSFEAEEAGTGDSTLNLNPSPPVPGIPITK
jgi:hypothetical protein